MRIDPEEPEPSRGDYRTAVEERARLELVLEGLPLGVLLLDGENRIVLANRRAIGDLPLLGVAVGHDRVASLGGVAIDEIVDRGQAREVEATDEQRRTWEVVARSLGPGDGAVVTLREVTVERSVRQQLERQERLAAVGQLATGIAHDFNNVLQGISTFAEILIRHAKMPSELRERAQSIKEQAGRGGKMIRQILDFTRRSISARRKFDLRRVVVDIVEMLRRVVPANVRLALEMPSRPVEVLADQTQIEQAIANLVINARDAMPAGGEIRLVVERVAASEVPPSSDQVETADWIAIRVIDAGTGISPAVASRVFEPFFTTKPPAEGTGLGLAQVYGIASAHHGRVGFVSEPGRGSTFTIYLPAVGEQRQESEAAGNGDLVLLVVADAAVREVFRDALETSGYRVLAAASAGEALRRLDDHAADVRAIVTDAAERLELEQARPEGGSARPIAVVRIIAATADARPGDLLHPVSGAALADAVRRAIDGSGDQPPSKS